MGLSMIANNCGYKCLYSVLKLVLTSRKCTSVVLNMWCVGEAAEKPQPCFGTTLMGFLAGWRIDRAARRVQPRFAPQPLRYQLIFAIIAQRVTGNALHQGLHQSSPPAGHTYTTLTSAKDKRNREGQQSPLFFSRLNNSVRIKAARRMQWKI